MADERDADTEARLRRQMAERAIREGRKRHALTIGELFPDDDAAAQWVFSLTALAEDPNVLVKPLRQAHDQEDLRASLYFYRQLVTRLYEARRIATAARTVPEIAAFVGDLLRRPPGGTNLEQAYRRSPENEPSRVERLYAELRHRTVHFPQPASDELAEALWQHSGYPAQIALGCDEDGRPTVWFQWVHAVTAGDVFGDVRDPEFLKSMTGRSNVVAALALSWTTAAAVAVPLHLRRLGIDSARLGQVPAGPSRSGLEPERDSRRPSSGR